MAFQYRSLAKIAKIAKERKENRGDTVQLWQMG
jgi:hypothetical protein